MTRKRDRQRKLARERQQSQLMQQAQRQRRIKRLVIGALAAVTAAAVTLGGVALAGVFSGTVPAATLKPSPARSGTATPSATPATLTVAEPAHHCTYTPSPPAARNVGLPPATPDYHARYGATIITSRGGLALALLNSKATCTVNSFVYLAGKKYFNHTPCHRLTTARIFVLQCGDPTGTGRGGPGYKFADENLAGATYPAGTVAMANSGPGTNGSQFFLVYKTSPLPPDYTPFGRIVAGINTLQAIAKSGTDNANGPGDGHPKQKVTIDAVNSLKI